MKKNLFVLILLCVISVINVNAGVNPAMRKEYDFKSFNEIRTVSRRQSLSGRGRYVTSRYKISLVKSDHYKVVMEVWNGDDIDLFEVRRVGNTVELVTAIKKYPYHSKAEDPCATVTIYTPEFPRVTLSGTSQMSVSGGAFSGDELSVTLSGVTKIDGLSGTWNKANITMSGTARMDNLTLKSGACYLTCSSVAEIAGVSSIYSDKVQLSMSGVTSIAMDNIYSGLANVTSSGASRLKSLEFNARELIADLSGTSSVKFVGKIDKISAEMQGASSLSLNGNGNEVTVSASGTSTLNAKNFTVKDASLKLSGVAGATVTVTEKLETETSGSSHIDYYGNPKTVSNKSNNVVKH